MIPIDLLQPSHRACFASSANFANPCIPTLHARTWDSPPPQFLASILLRERCPRSSPRTLPPFFWSHSSSNAGTPGPDSTPECTQGCVHEEFSDPAPPLQDHKLRISQICLPSNHSSPPLCPTEHSTGNRNCKHKDLGTCTVWHSACPFPWSLLPMILFPTL